MASPHRVRRWVHAARLDWVTGLLLLAFAVLRLVAGLGQPTSFFPDSPSYFRIDLWGSARLPVVPVWFTIVGDHDAIATIHVLLGVVCWAVAALVLGSVVERRAVRYGVQAAILLLGVTVPVTRWDSTMLSESTALSLTAVFTAAGLRFACRPTRAMAIFVLVAGALWGWTRSNHALLLAVIAVTMAVVGGGRRFRRVVWPVAAGLLLVAVVGTVLANSTSEIRDYNTGQIVVRRILDDPERLAWFEDHGMPRNGRAVATPPFPPGIYDPAKALEADPRFGRWIREDASRTYLRYLVSHPGYVLDTPFTHGGALPGLATGLTAYGSSEQVLPDFLEAVTWPRAGGDQTLLGAVVIAVLAAAAVSAVWLPSIRSAVAGAGVVLVAVVANLVIVTHTAGWEYERLVMSVGVAFRFAILWLVAALLSDLATLDPEAPAELAAEVTTPGPTESRDPGSDRPGAPSSDPAADAAPSTEGDPDAADTTATTSRDPVPDRAGRS